MKKVFIITGEYSGDMHASNVARHLLEMNSAIQIEAIGGESLKAMGIKLFADHSKMSAMGLSPKILLDHIKLGKDLVNYLTKEYKPDLVLLIDYGEKEMYESCGIKTTYCGHPLISQLPQPANREEFFAKYGLDPNKKLVSVFSGSRKFELKNLMETFIKSAKILKKMHPDIQIVFSQAPSIKDEVFKKYYKDCDFKVIQGDNQALLSCSDALILASGTVALEASLYNTPMIISYKGPILFWFIYLLVRCINRVCLPNIIMDMDIVPEILELQAKPDFIAYNIEKLLYDEDARNKQIEGLKSVREKLSDKNSSYEVAKEIHRELFED